MTPQLSNPKQTAQIRAKGWYRYYAGYSPEFVKDALRIVETKGRTLHVLDPWVGAGTTPSIAVDRGHSATSIDINPALVVIAKARLLRTDISQSLDALTADIIDRAVREEVSICDEEPLLRWFGPSASIALRSLERSIFHILVKPNSSRSALDVGLTHISPLAAFFYVALFRVTRSRIRSATGSNPTWVKARVASKNRARPLKRTLHAEFLSTQISLADFLHIGSPTKKLHEHQLDVQHGSSTSLNISDTSVDVVITSPPYCTRIDYVASVRPELAILGCDEGHEKQLRHMTMASPTIPKGYSSVAGSSETAKQFLTGVTKHPSKASTGYYHRYFDTYFKMLEDSITELERVTRKRGSLFLVVQDSFYNEILLDLPLVALELAEAHGWRLQHRYDFPVERTMAVINPRARQHRNTFGATESVLFLRRD